MKEFECRNFAVCGEKVSRQAGKKGPFTCILCKTRNRNANYHKQREMVRAKRKAFRSIPTKTDAPD